MKWANRVFLLTVIFFFGHSYAADIALPEKADRYYQMLLKRPQYGVVFDRFIDAWLEEKSLEELGTYLAERTKTQNSTAGDWLVMALVKVRLGQEDEALLAFDEGLRREPENINLWLERAKLEARMLAFDAALKSLANASVKDQIPDKTLLEVEKLKGRLLLRTGKSEEALNVWKALLQSHTGDEDLAEELVEMLLDEGLYDEATSQLQGLIGETRDAYSKVTRQLRLGEIYIQIGKKEDALKQFALALEAAGQGSWIESELLARIEQTFRREDNIAGLAKHLEEMIKAHPQRAAISRQLATVYAESDKTKEAEDIYKTLLGKSPGDRELRESYLDFLERIQSYPAAVEQTRLLIEQNKGDGELLIRLAGFHHLANENEAAKEELNRYLVTNNTEYDHLRIARIYEQWGRSESALSAYQKTVEIFSNSPSAQDAYAQHLHRNNKKDEAIALWTKLAEKGDKDQVLAVAQTLIARAENAPAFDILLRKVEKHQDDSRYLATLNAAALSLKEFKKALPWARKRIMLATDPEALDDALRQGFQIISGAEAIAEIKDELSKNDHLKLQERALLAVLLEESSDSLGAEDILRKAPEGDQLAAQARLVRLIEARRDWFRAAQEMEKLVSMNGGKTAANLQRLVQLRTSSGDPESSLALISEWRALSPSAPQSWLEEANLLAILNKPEDQIKVLQAACRRFDDDVTFVAALAEAYATHGNYIETERLYLGLFERAEELTEKLRWITALAKTAYSRGELNKLTTTFQERQMMNRQDAAPWLALAVIHETAQNQEERLKALQAALATRENDIALLHQIAGVQEDLGRWQEALSSLDRASRTDQTKRTRQMMAMLHFRWGEEEKGRAILLETLGGEQMSAKDALRVADTMMARQEWAAAAEFLTPLISRHPDDYRLPYIAGVAYMEDGRTDEALQMFVKTLNFSKELPEVEKARARADANATARAEQERRMLKLQPPGATDVQNIFQTFYDARRYDYNRRNNVSTSTNTSGVGVPSDLNFAHKYTQLQLRYLREMLSKDDIPQLDKALNDSMPHADLLIATELDSNSMSPSLADELLLQHINDERFCGLWVITKMYYRRQESIDPDLCRQVYDRLKEKYIYLASQVVIQAIRGDVERISPLLEDALQRMEADQSLDSTTSYYASYGLASLLGGGQQVTPDTRVELPAQLTEKICQQLIRSALATEKKGNKPVTSDVATVYAVNSFRSIGAWKEYAELWNKWLEKQKDVGDRNLPGQRQWSMYASAASSTEPLIKPLPFPYMDGPLPNLFVVMMHRADPWNPHIEPPRTGPEPEFAGLVAHLDKVENPDLRMILAHKADKQDIVKQMLDERLSQPSPGLDDYLFAAGFAGQQENHAHAAALLMKALALPMNGSRRMELDAALIHAVTNLNEDQRKQLADDVIKAAKQGARRLRSPKLAQGQSEELVTAFAVLGLKDEADQLKKQSAMLAAVAPSARSSVSFQSRTQTASRLEKLLAAGNEDAALRAVQQELQSLQRQYWANNQDYVISRGKELVNKLTFSNAKERLVALLQPPDGAGETRLAESAALLCMVGENASAIKILESVIEKRPTSEPALLNLLLLYASNDQTEKALELLEGLSWKQLATSQIGHGIVYKLRRGDGIKFEARMDLMEALAEFMEKQYETGDEPPYGAFDWFMDLPQAAASYDNNARIPQLYANAYSNRSSYYDNAKKEHLERRLAVHEKVCRAMLLDSGTASEAFRSLAGLAIVQNKEVKELVSVAYDILKKAAEDRSKGSRFRGVQQNSHWGDQRGQEFWRPEPLEFLCWQAWANGKTEQIEADILPLATRGVSSHEAKWIQAYARLWTSSPETFDEEASSFAKLKSSPRILNRPIADSTAIHYMIQVWQSRKLPAQTMDELVLAETKKNPRSYSDTLWLVGYINEREGDTSEAFDFAVSVIEAILGSRSGWETRMKTFLNQRYSSGGSINDPQAYRADNVTTYLVASKKANVGLMLAAELGMLNHERWRQNNINTAIGKLKKDPAAMLAFLDQSPLLGSAKEFSTWGQQQRSGRETGLQSVVNAIKADETLKSELLKSLNERKERTFGAEILLALLDKDVPAALGKVLVTRSSELATMPPAHHSEMASLVKESIPKLLNADVDPKLIEALKPIMAGDLKLATERAEILLAASQIDALQWTDYEFESSIPALIGQVLKKNPGKAKAVFLKASELMERKAAQKGWGGDSWTMGWTLRSELLDDFNDKVPGLPAMVLAMQLCEEDQSGNLILDGFSEQGSWGESLFNHWRNSEGLLKPAEAIQVVCKDITSQLGETRSTLLALGAYQFFDKLSPVSRMKVLEWADQKAGEDAIAREFAMAGRLFFSSHVLTRENKQAFALLEQIGGSTAAWNYYRETVTNDAINPRVRIALATHLCRKAPYEADEALVRKAASLCREAHMALQATQGEYHYFPIMLCYGRLPIDEDWKMEASLHWHAWITRNARNSESVSYNRAYLPSDEGACAILAVISGLGNKEWIRKVLRDSQSALSNDPSAFITLVSMGQHAEAEAWLDKNWESLLYHAYPLLQFHPSLESRVQEYIAQCTNKDLAVFGHTLFASLNDPPEWVRGRDFKGKDKRAIEAAEHLKKTTFANQTIRTRCLERLGNIEATTESLHKEYAEVMAGLDYEKIAAQDNTWRIWWRIRPASVALAWHAARGEHEPIKQQLQRLQKVIGKNPEYYQRYAAGYLTSESFWTPVNAWEKGQMGDLKKFAELMQFLQKEMPRTDSETSNTEADWRLHFALTAQLIIHAAEGDKDAMAAAVTRHSDQDKTMFKKLMRRNNAFTETLARFVGRSNPHMSLEDRLKLVRHLFANEFVASLYSGSDGNTTKLMWLLCGQGKAFSLEEGAELARVMKEVHPRNGRTAEEAEEIFVGLGKSPKNEK